MKRILFIFILSSLYSTCVVAGGLNLTVEKNRQALAQAAAQASSGLPRKAILKTITGDFVKSTLSHKEERQLRKSLSKSSLSPVQSPVLAAVVASL